MALADPAVRTFASSRQNHLDDHNRLRVESVQCVYSANYATPQAAIDDAITLKRPLVFEPVVHTLTAPLSILNAVYLSVSAYGATFQAGADLDALLNMEGTMRCVWRGGVFDVPAPYTAQNAVYVYHAEDGQSSSINTLRDVTITGRYVTGVRVGRADDTGQCDHAILDNSVLTGVEGVSLYGLYLGSGVFANNLNHVVTNLKASGHETHVHVSATNVALDGIFCDRATTDFFVGTTMFSLKNVRCEESQRFLVTSGPAGFSSLINVENVIWRGELLPEDGEWMQVKLAGHTSLKNVSIQGTTVTPKIKTDAPQPLLLTIQGLDTKAAYEDSVSANVNTTINNLGYIQIAENGLVAAVTI